MLDDIHVKVVLFRKDSVVAGLVSFELCFTTLEIVESIKSKLKDAGYDFAANLIIAATHTHTGPNVRAAKDNLDGSAGMSPEQFESLIGKAVCAIKEAYANLQDATLEAAKVNNNPCAFNRRYWMKDGKVQTNPPERQAHWDNKQYLQP